MLTLTRICFHCNQEKLIDYSRHDYSGWCNDCIEKAENNKLNQYLEKLRKLTLEQRIEKIEVLLYQLEKSGALQPPEQRKC